MIHVNDLTFSYTKKPFIQHMDFSVPEGEIFGFLGPSGAGKSTLQKILLGMMPNYQGSVMVNGEECKQHKTDFYEEIGVDFEYSTMYEKLTARENLRFFSSLYKKQSRSIDELLQMMKDMILAEKKNGKTIVLTTHNMQDATELCDRVAFIVEGQMFALDSPHNLIMSKGATKVTYTWVDQGEQTASCELNQLANDKTLMNLIAENRLQSIHSSEPTLNDIFMEITGRTLV